MELTAGSREDIMMKKVQGYPLPIGVTIQKDSINFSIVAPENSHCELLLFQQGGKKPVKIYQMPEAEGIGEVRFLMLEECSDEICEYVYRIDGKEVVDPYAEAVTGHGEFGTLNEQGKLRGVIYRKEFDWEGDRPLNLPYQDVVAYELHVRGFTMQKAAGVKRNAKGTFLGVIEKIPYFKELGINQIQCMPVYEFDECIGSMPNYWGYGPAFFFAPKENYASRKDAVSELKQMVRECHREGIEVVLQFPFVAGTAQQDVEKCLCRYLLEYHIDGFVLNPYVVSMEELQKSPLLKSTKLMKKEEGYQTVMRRFLKGDEGMIHDVIWSLRNNTGDSNSYNYITSHNGFTLLDLVSYDAKHNEANGERNQDGPNYNYSWNCGAEGPSRKREIVKLRKKQVRNALLLLLMSQGTPCILGGDEFGNSQKGNNNVYCQDNELGWLDWPRFKKEQELFEYVKALIAFRKKHPVLHKAEPLLGLDQSASGIPDVSYHGECAWQIPNEVSSRQLGVLYCGEGTDDEFYVAYNMHWIKHDFALPNIGKKKWNIVVSTSDGVFRSLKPLENQRSIEVEERSIVLLIGK